VPRAEAQRPMPWELPILEARALNGRQIERPNKLEVESNSGGRISRSFRVNRLFCGFPGLKPWAESYSPFGTSDSPIVLVPRPRSRFLMGRQQGDRPTLAFPWADSYSPNGASDSLRTRPRSRFLTMGGNKNHRPTPELP